MFSKIAKHSSRYFSSSLISAAAAFLMTKYYTVTFTPADFGIMTMYLVMFEYVVTFSTLSSEGSVSRKVFDYDEEERHRYLSTILWFYIVLITLSLIVGALLSDIISEWISPGSLDVYYIVLFSGFSAALVKLYYFILSTSQKSKPILKGSLINTGTMHPVAIILISIFKLDYVGRFIGLLLGSLFQLFYFIAKSGQEKVFNLQFYFDYRYLKETLILATPTIFSAVLGLLFIYLDRVFLKHYLGDTSVGLYGLALIIGKLLSLVIESLSTALFPVTIKGLNDNYDNGIKEVQNFSIRYYIALLFCSVVLALSSPLLVKLISSEEYSGTADVSPLVLLGIAMAGFYKIPSMLLSYHKIVWFYPILTIVSFGVNAYLNYMLIPSFGVVGAGISSLIGYFIYSFTLQLFCFKYYTFDYKKIVLFIYFLSISISSIFVFYLV